MQVNRTATGEIEIVVNDRQAGLLATILAGVSDCAEGESIDRLYNLLMDRGVIHEGTVKVEPNVMYDEEDPFDPFTHNFVLEG